MLNLELEESKLEAEGVRKEERVQRRRKARNEPARKRKTSARQAEAL